MTITRQIVEELRQIRWRLDDIERKLANQNPHVELSDRSILAVPDRLRRTYLSLASAKCECDAQMLANLTGRCRAVESNYLNQLCGLGLVKRRRISRSVYFRVSAAKPEAGSALHVEAMVK